MNIDKIKWLEQRNRLLSSFVNHTTAYDISNINEKKINAIVHSIEQIYYTRNIKLVTPFAFQRNVVAFSLTNSKRCASLTGCWESSGSYSTVHNYICSPSEQVECPIGHVLCAIDNNQKLGKSSGRIMVGSKMPVDICISISNFQISESTIQKDETLMPCEWQTNDFSE
ncbi:waaF [Mytilus coruscus]|uniref:WaaF n=1 Tax=Mytilus coruscus TaxID=42192 RepID=A0A6J7ZWV2_MYTCO|nr:waaF [Mytilus coruscus]